MGRGSQKTDGPNAGEIEQALRSRVSALAPELLRSGRVDPTRRYFLAGSVGGEAGESLVLNLTGSEQGRWKDFAGAEGSDEGGGDMLKLIAVVHFGGWSRDGAKSKAIAWAKSWLGWDDLDPGRLEKVRREAAAQAEKSSAQAEKEIVAKRKWAAAMWHGSVPGAGTPAQYYLEGRGIDFARLGRFPNALRFLPDAWCPERRSKHPAMIACIMAIDGSLIGIHRTFFDLSAGKGGPVTKARVENAKMSLGHYQGGCIPLWKGASRATLRELPAGTPVYCSEGIEDGLSIAMALPEARVIAGVALSNMGGIELPAQAGPLVFVGQNDPIGSKAVEAFERVIARQQEAGREVKLIFPRPEFKDFNDQLRGLRKEGAGG